jgi:hypothetical protein
MLTIKSATVLLSYGKDKVFLYSSLPCPHLPDESLALIFEAPSDTGVDYVRNKLNLEPAVLDWRNGD